MLNNKLYSKVFMWLFIGLLITFGIGYGFELLLTNNVGIATKVLNDKTLWIFIIAELAIAFILGLGIKKLNPTVAKLLYILYAIISGISFSAVFMIFKLSSILIVFLVTAIIFGLFAVIGSKLNVDLSKFGTYLFIALIGIIIISIINIFIGSSMLSLGISIASIVIFTLYIGYDIKIIKELANSDIDEENVAIYGAFQLYLDFINIFIRLLELFGDTKD